jgi:hypothetical protein
MPSGNPDEIKILQYFSFQYMLGTALNINQWLPLQGSMMITLDSGVLAPRQQRLSQHEHASMQLKGGSSHCAHKFCYMAGVKMGPS